MDEKQNQELQTMLEERLRQDFNKFRTQGIMIGWLAAFQTINEHIKPLRYKRDIVAYLEAEIERVKVKMPNIPEVEDIDQLEP